MRFTDIVGYVDYNTTGEFTVKVEKLELAAQLQEVKDKLKFFLLFFTGPVCSVSAAD